MLPIVENYAVYPAVIPAGKKTEMTVLATERAFFPVEGEEYGIAVAALETDLIEYYEPNCFQCYTAKAEKGVIRFSHVFEGEGQHLIRLTRGDHILAEMNVFSLKEDLYALRPMKGDLHSHSFRSDGQRDPAALAGHYREQGYDFFALTDHNRFYPGGEIDEVFDGIRTGFFRVPGEEVHTPGNNLHVVHVGGKNSVCRRYVDDMDLYYREVEEIRKKLPASIPEPYAQRYAMVTWASENVHREGGLAILAHPYWRPKKNCYNLSPEYVQLLYRSGLFDAYELIGGMGPVGNNRSVLLWSEMRAQGFDLPPVGSSDVHAVCNNSSSFPYCYTILFAKDATAASVIEAVKAGNCVAVNAIGDEAFRTYHPFGSLRLGTYAQFLMQHYFHKQERLCAGVGVAMRAFAIEEGSREAIEAQAALVDSFRDRFFGKTPPQLPSQKMLDFEEKWRKIHLEQGPDTKGSRIATGKRTVQI